MFDVWANTRQVSAEDDTHCGDGETEKPNGSVKLAASQSIEQWWALMSSHIRSWGWRRALLSLRLFDAARARPRRVVLQVLAARFTSPDVCFAPSYRRDSVIAAFVTTSPPSVTRPIPAGELSRKFSAQRERICKKSEENYPWCGEDNPTYPGKSWNSSVTFTRCSNWQNWGIVLLHSPRLTRC